MIAYNAAAPTISSGAFFFLFSVFACMTHNFGPPLSTDYSRYGIRSVPAISEAFNIRKVLGRGTYGLVLLASLKNDPSKKLALKFLVITQCRSAESEVEALQLLKGHDNVIELQTCVRYLDQIVLVFPAFRFNHYYLTFN